MTVPSHPRHLLSIDDIAEPELDAIFERASAFEDLDPRQRWAEHIMHRMVVGLLFDEPSTRTFLSFQSAVQRLGGRTISNADTSRSKGESLKDTIQILSGYADLIVLRHSGSETKNEINGVNVPVINAGDDSVEHPTQAVLDLFTIRRRHGTLSGLTVGIGFDPQHSRTLKSFCRALGRYPGNTVVSVAPSELQMADDDMKDLESRGVTIVRAENPNAIYDCPIVYVNRFQLERHAQPGLNGTLKEKADLYRLTYDGVLNSSITLILDPLPRVNEIEEKVDSLPQAGYFDQARFGLSVRMALLEWFVGDTALGRR